MVWLLNEVGNDDFVGRSVSEGWVGVVGMALGVVGEGGWEEGEVEAERRLRASTSTVAYFSFLWVRR